MSFSKTVSIFAALSSIFGASIAGWKLADSQKEVPLTPLDQRLWNWKRNLNKHNNHKLLLNQ